LGYQPQRARHFINKRVVAAAIFAGTGIYKRRAGFLEQGGYGMHYLLD